MSLLNCRELGFAYDGNKVLTGLNFEINQGDYLCIVGENGSGKSTLLSGLLGLKAPSEGSLNFNEDLRRNEIGYLPQQTALQKDFPASVYEVVLSGRLSKRGYLPFYSREDHRDASEKLELVGLANRRRDCYRELSGGQQRRVLLARALCAATSMLVLDEPGAGLDPIVTRELYAVLNQVNKELGMTIVMVSHDISMVLRDASHVLHLRGQQLYFGDVAGYLKTPAAGRLIDDNTEGGSNVGAA